jgi:ABC-2 type transport system ATP-binding protein
MSNLSVHSITKTFKHGRIIANDNISTQFLPGVITALTGHNGAGKTTLLNQIMGITKPDKGSVTFAGHSFVKEPAVARKMISMMPQLHAPLTGVTLRQSIEAILKIRGYSGSDQKSELDKVMNDLKITDWANTPGEKLSGGLQRLTSFAMTVVFPTPILLFDEPTNDVDPVRRKLIWQYLRKLADAGHIVIVVTHNLLEVDQYADRYLLLDHGHLVRDESTALESGSHFTEHVLTITVEYALLAEDFPQAIKVESDGALQYEIFLTEEQTLPAFQWLQKRIDATEIINYNLAPNLLNTMYGGLTDGDEL